VSTPGHITLRKVAVHNLKRIDLEIPHHRLVVLCGVSGSGKSSLAFDTLYAEGQRRYLESLSAYSRQFLEQFERPEAEHIEGLPAVVAVGRQNVSRSNRSTVGTATETHDYLRLLLARIGQVVCDHCGTVVRRHGPQDVSRELGMLPEGTRFLVAFDAGGLGGDPEQLVVQLRQAGFGRVVYAGRQWNLAADAASLIEHLRSRPPAASQASDTGDAIAGDAAQRRRAARGHVPRPAQQPARPGGPRDESERLWVVVDRLVGGQSAAARIHDSVETAWQQGEGCCAALVELPAGEAGHVPRVCPIDTRCYAVREWSRHFRCESCGRAFVEPEPHLFNFNHPLGACPACEGFGNTLEVDMRRVVPDPQRSIRDGAIAPWNTPAYQHELDELLALAPDYGIPVDVPFAELPDEAVRRIRHGVPERNFGGLDGFFRWLERKKYKMHIRAFLSRWRSYRTCQVCGGSRFRPEALAVRLGGKNIAEISAMTVQRARQFFAELELDDWRQAVGRTMLEQVRSRLAYLEAVGLGYLTLDRPLRTLSGGEAQRIALTGALGSSLVNMLYVLDEPSAGLHPSETERLLRAVESLRDRGNTVVVVEHEESFLRAADQLIEFGPGAGDQGGKIVFQGTVEQMLGASRSTTGDYLSGRRGSYASRPRRPAQRGWIHLRGVRLHNVNIEAVGFPLGVLCVVTGVSGSGKSTLVEESLYPAIKHRLDRNSPWPEHCDDVLGTGSIDDVLLVDQNPLVRSSRSNPVTYVKAFDEIRAVFAETIDARTRNYPASHFSFNVEGGRCPTCGGEGYLQVDMQFMADVYMRCDACRGTRYRPEILQVKYRGRTIADVLGMTAREAFGFFRGQPKVQQRLKRLMDVGLDYLQLGQPASTLSGGEAQRLKLAGILASAGRGRNLFLLDEPTTGLHFSDVVRLTDCFDALLAEGHSLIVVEHNLQLIQAADYLIDLGPGAGEQGGRIVAQGTPEEVAACGESITGRYLAARLRAAEQWQSA
jgi:excinuclease ABC subunit A